MRVKYNVYNIYIPNVVNSVRAKFVLSFKEIK